MAQSQQEIRKRAKEHKDNKDWAAAVALYEEIYSPRCDRWIAWEYADCLKKLSRLDDAITISKNLYQRERRFNHNNIFLSWLLFEKYFKYPKNEYSYNELNQLHEIAISITTFTTQDDKGSYKSTVIQMLKLHKKHGNNSSLKILELLQKLDVHKLSSVAGVYEQNGREKEYQSHKEMYYAMKTKALLESKKYKECISCCDEALLCVEDFHHDNKVWVISRKVVSMAHNGNIDEAIIALKETITSKRHWSLYEKIAEMYMTKKDSLNALLYFSMAAITNDPPKMKVSLYVSLADLLDSIGEYEKAWMHVCFVKDIREKEQWSITPTIQNLFEKLSVYKFNEKVHWQQLKDYWITIIYKKLGMYYGNITKVNVGGKTGFILSGKKSYFFKATSFVEKPYFKVQDKVRFVLVESFDSKKQCASLECDYIQFDKR